MTEHILIIRMSAIGDIVMSSPLAEALKKKYPNASLSWLVQPGMNSLLANNPYVDEVIVWPRNEWQQLWQQKRYWLLFKTVRQFTQQLKQRKFSIAIDAQGLLKSGLMAWFSGAKRRIGLNSKEGSQLLMSEVYRAAYSPKMGGEYRFLLSQLHADAETAMSVFISEADQLKAQQLIDDTLPVTSYIVFCPFSSRLNKNWFEQDWITLAEYIDKQFTLPCVILGGPADKAIAEQISTQCQSIYCLAGNTSLTQAAKIITEAKAVVGVDTGLTHIGVINDIPTVVLFGSTCPYSQTDSDVTRILYHGPQYPQDIKTPMFKVGGNYMDRIKPTEVFDSLMELLPE